MERLRAAAKRFVDAVKDAQPFDFAATDLECLDRGTI